MTLLESVLSRIELRRWPWKISLNASNLGESEIIHITESVLDRDSGEPINLGGINPCRPPFGLSESEMAEWVYGEVQRHVLHELAESFHFDGVRLFDPHRLDPLPGEEP